MKTKKMMMAALFCCAMTMAMLTACSVDDNPASPTQDKIVGKWYADFSGMTYAKWTFGKTWQTLEFKSDGTGEAMVYFTISEDEPYAREARSFSYTTTDDGQLKMVAEKDTKDVQFQMVGDKLMMTIDGTKVEYQKCDGDMAAKFDKWSKDDDLLEVPEPAEYTVFVYGNANGEMDYIIEDGFWPEAKKFLTDHNNVRVVCFYKYGKPFEHEGQMYFTGKYADPGDIVWFELTNTTDLENIRKKGFASLGMADFAQQLKLCSQ